MSDREKRNLLDILKYREISVKPYYKHVLEDLHEDSFCAGKPLHRVNLTSNSKSTIAIANSPDGTTFATTHGDHTVKVFLYHTKKQIRTFRGHPRTPWTVRYHPTNSDILASGCLGFNVRIWSIARDCCVKTILAGYSVISLAFHPLGDFLVVSSGTKLEIWQWQQRETPADAPPASEPPSYSLSSALAATSSPLPANPVVVENDRNVRAVAFHPSGQFLLVGAPSGPRGEAAGEGVVYSSLHCVPFWSLMRRAGQLAWGEVLRLDSFPTLLPQLHLYSDGGLDISPGGEHLLVCARLFRPPVTPHAPLRRFSSGYPFSPMSTVERAEEEEETPTPPPPSSPLSSLPSLMLLPPPITAPPALLRSHSEPCPAGHSPPLPLPLSFFPLSSAGVSEGRGEARALPPAPRTLRRHSLGEGKRLSLPSSLPSLLPPKRILFPPREMGAYFGERRPAERALKASLCPPVDAPPRGVYKDCLCVFTFAQPHEGGLTLQLVNAKVLSPLLVRAITSLKLSPTSRYALLGYGVRVEGAVPGHENSQVVCEVISLREAKLSPTMLLSDGSDEVNIAQFHPLPGGGLVYGTKGGRTLLHTRCLDER